MLLDRELTSQLKALGGRHGATLFMTVLAGWAAVLGRLANQTDVVIGSAAANRPRIELEGLIGFFLNTLALRIDLASASTIPELLRQVKTRALEAQQHQDLPFEQVVELVQPVRSLAHTPVFQVLFAWQSMPLGRLAFPGTTVHALSDETYATAKFDLTLRLREADGRIIGALEYATALFDRATVERYAGYLGAMLRGMVAEKATTIRVLPLVCAAERRQLLLEWNATAAEYPRQSCLHEPFEEQAARTPTAIALEDADSNTMTYAALNAEANRLARHLRARGVAPGTRVALCVERSRSMVVAMLGVLKAGATFVPLDLTHPPERLRAMIADFAPVLLLTRAELAARFSGVTTPIEDLDEPSAWSAEPAENLSTAAVGLSPDHLAYVTYTSGSTGHPKGVGAVHHKVLNLVLWYVRVCDLTVEDGVLLTHGYAFDPTYRNLLAPLYVGARLCLAREPFDPASILARIARGGITVVSLTPTALQPLAESDALRLLRLVLLVGEPPNRATLAKIAGPRPVFMNLYGPTECSGIVSSHRLEWDRAGDLARPVPAGKPVANARLYVLDREGELVPIGVLGEVYVGGVPVGPGYLNRPHLTADRYVPDPFGDECGGRLYRTGDLARWRPDGTLELAGRADFQVKIRGHRIELGEIETILNGHPAVRQSIVMAREVSPGEHWLVAYVVAESNADERALRPDLLRAYLGERLPAYMVPVGFMRLAALPFMATGKVDRKALPAPDGAAVAIREYVPPEGEVETALAEIWAAVLRVERVGRQDNFFELGGHSLVAVQLVSRVRQVLEGAVTVADVFRWPVLAEFARGVASAQRVELPPIPPVARGMR
jgi:amino acid adenylation domain-containing protein